MLAYYIYTLTSLHLQSE